MDKGIIVNACWLTEDKNYHIGSDYVNAKDVVIFILENRSSSTQVPYPLLKLSSSENPRRFQNP